MQSHTQPPTQTASATWRTSIRASICLVLPHPSHPPTLVFLPLFPSFRDVGRNWYPWSVFKHLNFPGLNCVLNPHTLLPGHTSTFVYGTLVRVRRIVQYSTRNKSAPGYDLDKCMHGAGLGSLRRYCRCGKSVEMVRHSCTAHVRTFVLPLIVVQ